MEAHQQASGNALLYQLYPGLASKKSKGHSIKLVHALLWKVPPHYFWIAEWLLTNIQQRNIRAVFVQIQRINGNLKNKIVAGPGLPSLPLCKFWKLLQVLYT